MLLSIPSISAAQPDWRTKLRQYQVDRATKASRLATKQNAAIAKKQADYYNLIALADKLSDQRTLQHIHNFDLSTYSNRRLWQQWQKVYSKSYPPIKYIPYDDDAKRSGASQPPLRIIAEMRSSSNYTNLDAELAYFHAHGYNTILAAWRGEDPYKLYTQIQHVKSLGFQVYFTYSGPEKLASPVLINTNTYAQGLRLLASACSGFITGWRRTSLHLWQEPQWQAYTIYQVRQANPGIYIFGEIYYGYDGKDDNHHKLTYNIPVNASGAIVVNLGNANHNQSGIYKKISSNPKTQRSVSGASHNLPLLSLVVGEHPYYLSRNPNLKTKEQNRSICKQIEQRITQAGFAGTITIAGDGSDGNYHPHITDDVSQSTWHVKNPKIGHK